jgi:hypothetical protein
MTGFGGGEEEAGIKDQRYIYVGWDRWTERMVPGIAKKAAESRPY